MEHTPPESAQARIRNFCIIAHIDHGKSTLADRMIEMTGLIDKSKMEAQMLDSMEVEKAHGITVKAQTVSTTYLAEDGQTYFLNLIDTPGHVDFSYEVSRSLAACEGVLLLVDGTQGIQAQTLSHFYQAVNHDLEILPVINKVDLPAVRLDEVLSEIEEDLGLEPEDALLVSAKTGLGMDALLEAIVRRIPPPSGTPDAPLQALVYDSYYDIYRGVVVKLRVMQGTLKVGDPVRFMRQTQSYITEELGLMQISLHSEKELKAGQVGYFMSAIKSIADFGIGDTLTHKDRPCDAPLPGYHMPKCYVFAGLFPSDGEDFEDLSEALQKLRLNDAALFMQKWHSSALGMGYKCGFLGLLHLEIVQERLEHEFHLNVISTVPSVEYEVHLLNKERILIESATELPDLTQIEHIREPFVLAEIITPTESMGVVMGLIQERRGIQKQLHYLNPTRVQLRCELPLAEIVYDFFDSLKSLTRGYASFDYEFMENRPSKVVKMDILVAGNSVDALAQMVFADDVVRRGKQVVERLRELIPRHMFQIPLQAAVGGRIVARETISAFRKDVTAKCYGGDITRKRKLLEKQKEGKKKMKSIGNVQIPQNAFVQILKR